MATIYTKNLAQNQRNAREGAAAQRKRIGGAFAPLLAKQGAR